MDFKFIITANSNTHDFRVKMSEFSAPNTAIASQDVSYPHNTSQQVVFTGLNPVTHFVRVYELSAGVEGQIIGNSVIFPTPNALDQSKNIEILVGNDMLAGQEFYDGSTAYPSYSGLIAKQDYWIERRGTGALKDDEYQQHPTSTFGFELTNGLLANDGETFIIHFYAKLVVQPTSSSSTSSNSYQDVITLTSDTDLSSTHRNKIINIASSLQDYILIKLDYLANVPDMTMFKFLNHDGLQRDVVIRTRGNVPIKFVHDPDYINQTQNEVVLGKAETIEIIKKGNEYYVTMFDGNFRDIGEPTFGFAQRLNTYPAEGELVDRSKFYRIWKFVQQNLSATVGGLVDESNWSTNKTCFSSGDGSTTFRFPDLRGYFFRGLDDTGIVDIDGVNRKIGEVQSDQNKKHGHGISSTNALSADPNLTDKVDMLRGGNLGTINFRGLEDTDGLNTKTIKSSGGTESRPKNISFKVFVKI